MNRIMAGILCGALGMSLLVGCATTEQDKTVSKTIAVKTPTDQSLIRETLDTWKSAIIAKDIDRIMTAYSEKYRSERGDGKQEIKVFLTKFRDRGDLDGVSVSFKQMKIEVNGATAAAGPIEISSDRGGMELSVTLGKEADKWLIVGSNRK